MTAPTPIPIPPTTTTLLRDLALAATTPGTMMRYEHGGGRLCVLEPERTLIADFYQEEDREFYAACSPAAILDLLERLERAEALIETARPFRFVSTEFSVALKLYDTAAKAKGAGE